MSENTSMDPEQYKTTTIVSENTSTDPEKYKKKSPLCQKTLPRILNNTKQPP
jgi:hypothetical protein